tara:strand:- start:211 stop:657 length:447 start_codon:yes stop_codon:yes gene_type:complete
MVRYSFLIAFFISLSSFAQYSKIKNPINTGVNMTVAILAVDSCIAVGDTIVALYKIDNLNYKESKPDANPDDFTIAGLTVWKGERLAIALWGNDSTSDKQDGFLNNETINWAIIKNNKYVPVNMMYRVGNNHWKPNGISIVDSVKAGC